MVDPRRSVLSERLKRMGKTVAVSSGEGGVGPLPRYQNAHAHVNLSEKLKFRVLS